MEGRDIGGHTLAYGSGGSHVRMANFRNARHGVIQRQSHVSSQGRLPIVTVRQRSIVNVRIRGLR